MSFFFLLRLLLLLLPRVSPPPPSPKLDEGRTTGRKEGGAAERGQKRAAVGSNIEERGQQVGSEAGSGWAAGERKVGQKKGEGAKFLRHWCLFVCCCPVVI